MGRVYAGVHRRSGVPVALKFMAGRDDPARFAHEVEAVAGLDHPHIVWVLDHGVSDDDGPWLAMQRATGTLVDERGAPWGRVRRALDHLLEALAHAHARGVI
ncbi:MAG: serine/threonine-protein kinase PknK, partial [Myxococcota bacterium]